MRILKFAATALAVVFSAVGTMSVGASEFNQPWRDKNRALVIDGYENNQIDLVKMATDDRIAAFIHKSSDGLPAAYRCTGNRTAKELCRYKWRRYAVARELYHTRRALAKALGMKWGAYHLARPGNPLDQARHFLSYADPQSDETMVLDLEDNDPNKWMSLEDGEKFVNYIYKRTGRWPMLYTNGSTAKHIAHYKEKYPILSRLPLWYARYKPSIESHFPKGNWETYDIWQFQAQNNCSKSRCAYDVKGANKDIDVNVVNMSVEELKAAWPMDQLVPIEADEAELLLASGGAEKLEIAPALNAIVEPASPSAIFEGYYQAAASKGHEVPVPAVDRSTSTSSIAKSQSVNDLF